MTTTNNFVFKALTIIAWLIFIGLCIEAGGLVVNCIFTIIKPEMVDRLYQKLDLTDMYARSPWAFFSMYSFILMIAFLKAGLFYRLAMLLTKIDLMKPFSDFTAGQILQISYYTLSIGLFSYVARQSAKTMQHHGFLTEKLNAFWEDAQAFILMAAVVYVIAQIFKRGLALQKENDLTV
jgi:hypothetical protein